MLRHYSVVSTTVLLLVSLTSPAFRSALSAENPPSREAEKDRVTCPAVEMDESQRPINSDDRSPCPIQLVVLGTAKCREPHESQASVYEVQVEKVLYGGTADKTLRFHEYFDIPGPKRKIFALVPKAYAGPTDYELKYYVDVKEEKSQLALSAARFDYHALAADAIFIGKEIAVNDADDTIHTIKVVRLLHGSEPKPGKQIIMEIHDHIRTSGKVVEIRREPMLYFLRIEKDFLQRKVYRIDTRLPTACEADVAAALKRRDLYPIVETTEEGKKFWGREVMFRGSVDEALDFLGSERTGAIRLAVRAITRQPDAAREKLAAAIVRGAIPAGRACLGRVSQAAQPHLAARAAWRRLVRRSPGPAAGERVELYRVASWRAAHPKAPVEGDGSQRGLRRCREPLAGLAGGCDRRAGSGPAVRQSPYQAARCREGALEGRVATGDGSGSRGGQPRIGRAGTEGTIQLAAF